MKSIENAVDLGLGLLILILVANTALYGLNLYQRKNLNQELKDKNTVSVIVHTPASDNLTYTSLDDMEMAIFSASRNRDNVREITIEVVAANNTFDTPVVYSCGAIHELSDVRNYVSKAIKDYSKQCETNDVSAQYKYSLDNKLWTLLTTEEQGKIVMHILLKQKP